MIKSGRPFFNYYIRDDIRKTWSFNNDLYWLIMDHLPESVIKNKYWVIAVTFPIRCDRQTRDKYPRRDLSNDNWVQGAMEILIGLVVNDLRSPGKALASSTSWRPILEFCRSQTGQPKDYRGVGWWARCKWSPGRRGGPGSAALPQRLPSPRTTLQLWVSELLSHRLVARIVSVSWNQCWRCRDWLICLGRSPRTDAAEERRVCRRNARKGQGLKRGWWAKDSSGES